MAKNLSVSVLMDFYGELLTDKQKEALDLYYNQDFSLAEIAENMDISRQGVRDFVKRGEIQLEEFEEKLQLLNRFSKISNELTILSEGLERLKQIRLSQNAADLVNSLKEAVDRIEADL